VRLSTVKHSQDNKPGAVRVQLPAISGSSSPS
jgi:hypothetical protein